MTTCLIDYEAASCRAAGNVICTNNNIVRPNFSIWRNLAHYAYQLSFGENEIRPYFMTVVDNPGCMSGTPVTLSWEFDEDEVHKLLLDEYEKSRGPKRNGKELFLSRMRRDFFFDRPRTCSVGTLRSYQMHKY